MSRLHTIGTLALGSAFAVTIIGFSFFQPFIPGAVCESIPAEASFTYKVKSLDELLKSPVCGQLDKALGAGNTLRDLVEYNKWTRLTAPSEIAVADLPFLRTNQNQPLIASTWVGWRSPWIRWKLEHSGDKNLHFLGKHAVWPIWVYETPDLARGMSLSFALTDNLFLICLSESPTDILYMLDAYDQRIPSVATTKGCRE